VDSETLQLRSPANRVSRRAIGYWSLRAGVVWLILLALQVVWLVGDAAGWVVHVIWLVITVVIAATHVLVMPQWRFHVHRWEATADAVYTQAGWFNQTRRIAPVSRIQTVDQERGPLEQLFGLANVTVTTASAAGPIKIGGLRRSDAERLVHDLTLATQAAPGDAT
jgi:membrane protein YdbS with pleckstrin-like domain